MNKIVEIIDHYYDHYHYFMHGLYTSILYHISTYGKSPPLYKGMLYIIIGDNKMFSDSLKECQYLVSRSDFQVEHFTYLYRCIYHI